MGESPQNKSKYLNKKLYILEKKNQILLRSPRVILLPMTCDTPSIVLCFFSVLGSHLTLS